MYERILMPLDGSRTGEAALPLIEELAAKLAPAGLKVEVILFQVVAAMSHWVVVGETGARIPYTQKELEILKKEAQDYLEKTGEGLRKKGATVRALVVFGDAADEIIKAADDLGADMIAMSTHGRSGLSRWAFGSVTGRVLRASAKPVLTVRAKGPATTDDIAYPSRQS
ncbi:MAG: universal stress protein [Dehalococcoidales bacterium]|nr:universal stress protein [Dehalococcoidales bacterium]